MKVVLSIIFSIFLTVSFGQMVVNDPNVEVRNVSGFEAIDVSGGIDVVLTKGNSEVVAVSAANEVIRNRIITEVKNGTLRIRYDNSGARIRINEKLKVYVSYTSLKSIVASGACDVSFAETFTAQDLRLKLNGASVLKGKVEISNLAIDLSGASTAKLNGSVSNLKLESSGASDLKGYNLIVDHCVASLSGASDVRVYVNKSILVKASGASTFFYKGSPDKKDVSSSGASNVTQQ